MQPDDDGSRHSIGGEHDRTPGVPAPAGRFGAPLIGAVPDGPLPTWGLIPGARFLPFGPIDEDPAGRRGPDDPGLPGALGFGSFGRPTPSAPTGGRGPPNGFGFGWPASKLWDADKK